MKKRTKKYKSLCLLAEGKTQVELVRKHGFNKFVLCRNVREFLQKGWLKVNVEHTNPKTYRATPKAPIHVTVEKGQLLHQGVYTRLHHTIWKMTVLSEIKREISWDKKIRMRNGVFKYYLFFPSITIEFIPTQDGLSTVVVFPHEHYLNSVETKKHLQVIKNDMRIVRAWLQRVLLCRLSIPIEIQEKHLARPILNPVVMRVLKKSGRIVVGDVWIDASERGFEFGEIESVDAEKLKTLEMLQWSDMNIPLRVSRLEEDLNRIETSLNRIVTVVERIDSMFNKPPGPDEKREVA